MKILLAFVVLIHLFSIGQESNCFKKINYNVTSGEYRGRTTTSYWDSKSGELMFFTYTKFNTLYVVIEKVKPSFDLDFYLKSIKSDTVTIDSNFVFDNSQFDPNPVIGVGKMEGAKQVGIWYYFDRFSMSLFAIVEYNSSGQLHGRYTLFKNGSIFVDGFKVNNRNHGTFFGYHKGRCCGYYRYDNGVYLGRYKLNKEKIIHENSQLINTYHYLF